MPPSNKTQSPEFEILSRKITRRGYILSTVFLTDAILSIAGVRAIYTYVPADYFRLLSGISAAISTISIVFIFFLLSRFFFSFLQREPSFPRNRLVTLTLIMSGIMSIILLFGSMYNLTGLAGDCAANTAKNDYTTLYDDLYVSVITFTTVGYGDCHPSEGPGRLVAAFEALTGYVVLGLLVSALSGIFQRRS